MQALVLGGGGAKGAYEVGVWRALIEMDIPIHIVVGTSIGAVNASLVAQGDYDKALNLWYNFDAEKMLGIKNYHEMDLKKKMLSSMQIFSKDLIKEGGASANELKEIIDLNVDENKVRQSKTKFGVVTVNIDDRKPVEIFIDQMGSGQMSDYIMASSAIVPAIKPYEIDGKKYIDGTFHDNIPIAMAQKAGANKFIVVDLDAFGKVNKESLKQIKELELIYVKCYWDLGYALVYDKKVVDRNLALGYLDTLKAYGAFDGNAYTFIKDEKIEKLNSFSKNDNLLKKIGILSDKNKLNIGNQIVQSKWEMIREERHKRGGTDTNAPMICLEIAAEIMGLDPTKLYKVDQMEKKITQALKNVKAPARKATSRDIWKNIATDIQNITDDQKRLKYLALEIKEAINKGDVSVLQVAAGMYTRTFFAGMYLAIRKLV